MLNVYKVAVLSGDLTVEAKNYAGEPVTLSYEEASMQYTGDFAVADSRKDTYMNLAVEGAKNIRTLCRTISRRTHFYRRL